MSEHWPDCSMEDVLDCLTSSNGAFPNDPNEIFSWDSQGQIPRFGWGVLSNMHTHTLENRVQKHSCFQIILAALLALCEDCFLENGRVKQSSAARQKLCFWAPGTKGRVMLKAWVIGLPLFQELFGVIKTEPGRLNTRQSSLCTLNLVL